MTKVFISYSHDSPQHADRVLALADRLVRQGVDCILDQYEDAPPEGWPRWMTRQIREADLVLMVCTQIYYRRVMGEEASGTGLGVRWEGHLIYQHLYNAETVNRKFVPVLLDPTDNAYIPDPVQAFANYVINTEEGYELLYRRLTNQPKAVKPDLGERRSLPPRDRKQDFFDPANPKRSPATVWNVPFERNVFFTGREKELEELRQALAQNSAAALSQTQAISGLGGIGKTQIAVEYAYRHREDYKAVFWVRADSEQSIITGYGEVARLLHLPEKDAKEIEDTVRAVKRWLEREEGWLLIFDNADNPSLLKPYKPTNVKEHILITSRAQNFDVINLKNAIGLREMLVEDAIEFLLDRGGRNKNDEWERGAAAKLARELGCLPLALEQAGAYIREKKVRIQDYLISYEKRRLELLSKSRPVTGDYPESVATTWSMNFEEVERESKAAIELLRLSAFLSPDNIPFELIIGGRSELSEDIDRALEGVEDDPVLLSELLNPLSRYSLITVIEESRTYKIHRMIQEVIKSVIEGAIIRDYSERVVRAIQRVFPSGKFGTWPECERLLDQGKKGVELIDKWALESEEAGELLLAMALYFKERGQYAEAELLLSLTLKITEKSLGEEHPKVAASLNNLALLYRFQGQYALARPLYNRALKIYEKALGKDHPNLATTLDNLAMLYQDEGGYAEAEPRYKRALEIREKALGEEHSDVAQSVNNLALLYYNQSRYAEAEPLFQRALKIHEKVLGEDHPDVGTILNNLALLFNNQGRYKEAETFYKRALNIYERALEEDHPSVAQSVNNLALLYYNQGRYTEAELLSKRALRIYENTLREDHPAVAISLNNLASIYFIQNRYEEAEPLHKRALDIREKSLGEYHPDVAQSVNNLALLSYKQGSYKEAASLLKRALRIYEKVLGKDHPDLAMILNNLAETYSIQSLYEEAEPLHKRALNIREKALGEYHPSVSMSLNNLALLYDNQGRYAEAEAYYKQTLRIIERSLGEDHPYFTTTMNNYSDLLRKMQRNEEAEAMEARAEAIQERITQLSTPPEEQP